MREEAKKYFLKQLEVELWQREPKSFEEFLKAVESARKKAVRWEKKLASSLSL